MTKIAYSHREAYSPSQTSDKEKSGLRLLQKRAVAVGAPVELPAIVDNDPNPQRLWSGVTQTKRCDKNRLTRDTKLVVVWIITRAPNLRPTRRNLGTLWEALPLDSNGFGVPVCVCVCVVLLYSIRLQARGVKNLSSTQLNYKKNLSCGTPVMGRRKMFEHKKIASVARDSFSPTGGRNERGT